MFPWIFIPMFENFGFSQPYSDKLVKRCSIVQTEESENQQVKDVHGDTMDVSYDLLQFFHNPVCFKLLALILECVIVLMILLR